MKRTAQNEADTPRRTKIKKNNNNKECLGDTKDPIFHAVGTMRYADIIIIKSPLGFEVV